MMRCLMCGCEKEETSLEDLLNGKDPLCQECRRSWIRKNIHFRLDGIPVFAPYVYNEAFASCLIQFKECGDEALRDVFLYGLTGMFRRRYSGCSVLLMPSSEKKQEMRGFSHLAEIYGCTGMEMMSPFVKKSDISQKQKGYMARMQMKKEIVLKKDAAIPDRVVLVDDTITTGATLLGALSCLERKGRHISIFSLSANQKWLERQK